MYKKEALRLHKNLNGKLDVISKIKLNKDNLKLLYTPGVADVSLEIDKNPGKVYEYTIKRNSLAIVTDGSAVLGLGNIGPKAAMPVMEGKSIIFKEFAGINAFPICLDTQETDEIIKIVQSISPVFGGINLEDISAPRCFEIEEKLQDIGIPVFHDDQHGIAIAVLAGLINSLKLVNKDFHDIKIVISGAGAAGIGIAKFLCAQRICEDKYCSVKEIVVLDSKGAIYHGRGNLNSAKKSLAKVTNLNKTKGDLKDVLDGADVFIGVSKAGILKAKYLKKMKRDPIVFALANPVPEILPSEAKKGGAKIIATGRSDFDNQINNLLVFPGIFKGALELRSKTISFEMKMAATWALAKGIKKPTFRKILPSVFDKTVVKKIAKAVKDVA